MPTKRSEDESNVVVLNEFRQARAATSRSPLDSVAKQYEAIGVIEELLWVNSMVLYSLKDPTSFEHLRLRQCLDRVAEFTRSLTPGDCEIADVHGGQPPWERL